MRTLIDDGNFGGRYQRDDSEMLEIWDVAVQETRALLEKLVMAERILIWGAGAIGGSVGAWLKRAGHDITFVDVVPEHVAAIRDSGLRITGPVEEFTVHTPAFTPEELTGTWQRIFLAVKAQHTEAATRALTPHLAQDGYVLSLQNGLNELIIQRIVGRDRTIGAFINFGADWMAPGEIMFGNRGAVVLGELDGAMTPRLEALHASDARLRAGRHHHTGHLVISVGQAWLRRDAVRPGARPEGHRRLPGTSGIAAGCGVGSVRRRSWWRWPRVSNRAASTATTSRPSGLVRDEGAARRSVAAMVAFNSTSAKTHSGVWRDLAIRKRRTEVDVQIAPDRRDRRAPRHRLPRHAQAGRDDPRGGGGSPHDDRRQSAGTGRCELMPAVATRIPPPPLAGGEV